MLSGRSGSLYFAFLLRKMQISFLSAASLCKAVVVPPSSSMVAILFSPEFSLSAVTVSDPSAPKHCHFQGYWDERKEIQGYL